MDEDIAAARATAWRMEHPPRMEFHAAHDVPPPSGERVRLSDGAEIVVRPVEPDDRHEIELASPTSARCRACAATGGPSSV